MSKSTMALFHTTYHIMFLLLHCFWRNTRIFVYHSSISQKCVTVETSETVDPVEYAMLIMLTTPARIIHNATPLPPLGLHACCSTSSLYCSEALQHVFASYVEPAAPPFYWLFGKSSLMTLQSLGKVLFIIEIEMHFIIITFALD